MTRYGWLHELGPRLTAARLDLLALLWPTACVGCGAPDRDLCAPCARRVRGGAVHEALSQLPSRSHVFDAPCFVGGDYSGELRDTLVAFKHAGMFGFAGVLGERLAAPLFAAAGEARAGDPQIVALPSRAASVRARGYRHVDTIISRALRSRGVASRGVLVRGALRPARGRTGQVGLDAAAREQNARRLVPGRGISRLRGREVILVDDIITTGATMRAAIEVCSREGATVIAVVALCATARKDTREKLVVEARS